MIRLRFTFIAFLMTTLPALPVFAGSLDLRDTSGTDSSSLAQTEFLLRKDKSEKPPRQYIRSCIFINRYGGTLRDLKPFLAGNLLRDYRFRQVNSGFYFPIMPAISKYTADGTGIKTFHLLLTGNFQESRPIFSGLSQQHRLYKNGLGIRAIYGDGNKNVFFWETFAYATGDRMSDDTRRGFLIGNLIWSRTVSQNFAFRLGFTRTYFAGNRFHLPVLGVRFGKLDKRYVSLQFPRSLTFWQALPKGKGSVSAYMKPFGGMYSMSNKDSIYLGPDKVIQFGRSEFLYGIQLDITVNRNFSFFVSPGISGKFLFSFTDRLKDLNGIAFFSETFNRQHANPLRPFAPFYREEFKTAQPYLNLGMSFRFGKTKRVAGNQQMYDILDINQSHDPGDNNDHVSGSDIPSGTLDPSRLKYKDIEDLLDLDDLQ